MGFLALFLQDEPDWNFGQTDTSDRTAGAGCVSFGSSKVTRPASLIDFSVLLRKDITDAILRFYPSVNK
jgi:hypothetical protein